MAISKQSKNDASSTGKEPRVNAAAALGFINGVGFTPLAKRGKIGEYAPDGRAIINSYIRDRLSGVTYTEEVMSGVINSAYVSRMLSSVDSKEAFARFFISNKMVDVVTACVTSSTWRVGGPATRRRKIVKAVQANCNDANAAFAIVECILPVFVKNGLVRIKSGLFTKVTYPAVNPTIDDVIREFTRQMVLKVSGEVGQTVNLAEGVVYSVDAMAEEIASGFVPLGVAMMSSKDFDVVTRDIVRGVRARIDPQLTGLVGSVPDYIYNHDAVVAMSTNYTFIEAALAIKKGTTIRVMCDGSKFERWAPTVLTMLRTSERYSIEQKSAAIATLGRRVIRDLRGTPRAVLMYEDARMVANAMTVTTVPDATFDGAVVLTPADEALAEHIAASYAGLPQTLCPAWIQDKFVDILRDAIETGDEAVGERGIYHALYEGRSLAFIATMMADSVSFKFGDESINIVYRIKSEDKFFESSSGTMLAGALITTDPCEVIMCSGDALPQKEVTPPPQFLGRSVMYNSVMNLEPGVDFVSLNERFPFSAEILGQKLQGNFRANELESMEVNSLVSLVRPDYNQMVASVSIAMLHNMYALASRFSISTLKSRSKRTIAQAIQDINESTGEYFRNVVHNAIETRSGAKLEPRESTMLRATLGQRSLRAITDVYATSFFLIMQGLVQHKLDKSPDAEKDLAEVKARQNVELTLQEGSGTIAEDKFLFLHLLEDPEIAEEWIAQGSNMAGYGYQA